MRSPQAIAVAVALVIGVLLFIAPRIPEAAEKTEVIQEFISAPALWEEELQVLSEPDRKRVEQWALNTRADSIREYFSLRHRPIGAAAYMYLVAEKSGKTADWMKAATDFYKAAMLSKPEQRSRAYSLAIHSCDMILRMEPGNREARLKKAVCLVEQKSDPMKGVALLKELIAEDSTFVDAHIQLGFFSMQSGQWEKAESRFRTALRVDSNYVDAWLYLGQALELKGDKEGAIKEYEKYYTLTTDTLIRSEVRKYIDKLKQ
ncbi:MAG: tetratricopeptide repeat protein [Bacteroidia bacterium]|nr:tetratricopeptide repeat protein [Bacteroidia bacterium]